MFIQRRSVLLRQKTSSLLLPSSAKPSRRCLSMATPAGGTGAPWRGKRGRAVYVAASKEHTGKTSVSMALLSGLVKRFGRDKVAYMKPVGQKYVEVEDGKFGVIKVDKDVKAVREHFGFNTRYRDMSPVILDGMVTRRYLDGAIDGTKLRKALIDGFEQLIWTHDFVVVEGTGHGGVGSIVGWNNAEVAKLLGLDVILVANGGVGNTFDQLELNRQLCVAHNVKVAGIIVNKVKCDKLEQCRHYLSEALHIWRWEAPIVGLVPMADSLDKPSLLDLEKMFKVKALAGRSHLHRRFNRYELVTTSLGRFLHHVNLDKKRYTKTCFVTHASRNDIIIGMLSHYRDNAPPMATAPLPGEGGAESGRSGSNDVDDDVNSNADAAFRKGPVGNQIGVPPPTPLPSSSSSAQQLEMVEGQEQLDDDVGDDEYDAARVEFVAPKSLSMSQITDGEVEMVAGAQTASFQQQQEEVTASRVPIPFEGALLLTGSPPGNMPHSFILEYIRHGGMPVLTSSLSTTSTLRMLENFTAKMSADDYVRTNHVIQHYEPCINFDLLLSLVGKPENETSSSTRINQQQQQQQQQPLLQDEEELPPKRQWGVQ